MTRRFLKLFKKESEKKIRQHADETLKRSKNAKPILLPLSSDIAKLAEFTKKETEELASRLKITYSSETYHQLVRNVLFRLTSFNRRRGGAVEKMKIQKYLKPTDVIASVSEETMSQLTPEEMTLLTSTKLVEVEHKCDNFVQI